MGKRRLTGSEALYGFGAWLTTRRDPVGPFSGHHPTTPMSDLLREFCKVNRLGKVRKSWPENLVIPKD